MSLGPGGRRDFVARLEAGQRELGGGGPAVPAVEVFPPRGGGGEGLG